MLPAAPRNAAAPAGGRERPSAAGESFDQRGVRLGDGAR